MNQLDREHSALFPTYKRIPIEIDHAEGCKIFATDGRVYLDLFAGIAVNALGHAHPRVVQAISDQAAKYIHTSNYFLQEPQIRLAELIHEFTGCSKVFFTNSGTEATEGAIKIARRWASSTPKRKTILSFSNAFHGRTYGALSMMDRPKYRDTFGPFLDGFSVLPFNDVAALRQHAGPDTIAIFLEPIQGEGGIRPITGEFAAALQELRDRHGFLIVADEIQAGVGRTGLFLSSDRFNLRPDIVTLAKPIGGGLPLGAILGYDRVKDVLEPGIHGTTFGGNPVACAAGIAVLEEMREKKLLDRALTVGSYMVEHLHAIQNDFPGIIQEVRGYGLMVGVELTRPGDPIVEMMRELGVLINCTDGTVLRIVPPLTVEYSHVDRLIESLRECMKRELAS